MRGRLLYSCRLVGLICLLTGASFPAYPLNPQGLTVYGRVFLPNSQPAVQVVVNISAQNGFNASTKTDGRGGFRFEGLPRSIFSLTVVAPSNTQYRAEQTTVDGSRESGNSVMADIFLRQPLEPGRKKEKTAQVVSLKEASQNIPKDARKAFGKAQKYREQSNFPAALTELNKAISIYPEYFQAFAEKGVVQINSGQLQAALLDFNKALELVPEYEPALSGAGYCLLTLGQYEQSIANLEKAARLNSTRITNLLFLGIANLALSRWPRAQEVLEQALKLDAAGAVSAHMYLADALAGQHLYRRAADELRTYLRLNPAAPNADRLRQREKYWRAQKAPQQ